MNREILLVSLLSGAVGLVSVVVGAVVGLSRLGQLEGNKAISTITERVAPSSAKLSLSTNSPTVKVGEPFNVDINLDSGGKSLQGIDVVVSFDPQKLTAVDADTSTSGIQLRPGALFSQPIVLLNKADSKTGKAYLSTNSFTPFSGSGVYGTIVFKAKTTGQTQVSFSPPPETVASLAKGSGSSVPLGLAEPLTLTIIPGQ